MIVAIDGPAGAGKSTVARRLAERLGFRYLDTGAMYRALTWLARQRGVPLGNGDQLGELAAEHPVGFDEQGRVWIADTDVTSSIRKADIDSLVPVVARHPAVRKVMRARQQELADDGNVVIEGRDIGTVVAPQAAVKVYLNADRSVRASRRLAERPEIGADALATDLRLRDESDAARMRPAEDAQQIDTTDLDVEDVVAQIAGHQHRVGEEAGRDEVLLGRAVLELRHPAQLAEARDRAQQPGRLGVGGDVALDEDGRAVGVEPGREQQRREVERRLAQLVRLERRRDRVQVDDAEERLALLLGGRVLAEAARVVAERLGAGGSDPAENPHGAQYRNYLYRL